MFYLPFLGGRKASSNAFSMFWLSMGVKFSPVSDTESAWTSLYRDVCTGFTERDRRWESRHMAQEGSSVGRA